MTKVGVKGRTIAAALIGLLGLGCSMSSSLFVANTTSEALAIHAELRYKYDRGRTGPIQFADARNMRGYGAWRDAPESAITVDPDQRGFHLVLPAGTAARVGSASYCDQPATCDDMSILALELSGTNGSIRLVDFHLREAFATESRSWWVLWYPLTGVHGFWKNLHVAQAVRFCLALCVAAFTLWAAVLVARTPMPRRWGWAAIALLGIGRFAINWTTGETTASFLSLPVLVASIGRGDVIGPWIVAFSLPVGAIVALMRRQYVLRIPRVRPAPTPDASTGADE